MNAHRVAILLGGLLVAAPVGLAGQQQPVIVQGSRIRVSAPSISLFAFEGTVIALKPDTVTLDAEVWRRGAWITRVMDVPLSSLASLEVGQKGGSNVGRGALLGGVIGAAPGLLLAVALLAESGEDEWFTVGADVLLLPVFTGVIGAGIGAFIGAMSHRTTWVAVPLEDYRVNLVALDSGLGVSVSIRF